LINLTDSCWGIHNALAELKHKIVSVTGIKSERRFKDTSFVAANRMGWIQGIFGQLARIDGRPVCSDE